MKAKIAPDIEDDLPVYAGQRIPAQQFMLPKHWASSHPSTAIMEGD